MGHSPRAKLIYGYDLGSDEDGWSVAEYDEETGEIAVPWQTEPLEGDFVDAFDDRLRETGAGVGVDLEYYGYEMDGNALAAFVTSIEWGAKLVDLDALISQAAAEEWDDRLAAAIAALGITPKQEKPGWLLAAMYG